MHVHIDMHEREREREREMIVLFIFFLNVLSVGHQRTLFLSCSFSSFYCLDGATSGLRYISLNWY